VAGAVQQDLTSSWCGNWLTVKGCEVGSGSQAISKDGIPGEMGASALSTKVELLSDRDGSLQHNSSDDQLLLV